MQVPQLNQVGNRHLGPAHRWRNPYQGRSLGEAWRLGSQKQALLIQFLYLSVGTPKTPSTCKYRAKKKKDGTVSPSLVRRHCPRAAALPRIFRPCQVDVSISGTSVDTSVGTASRWGGT